MRTGKSSQNGKYVELMEHLREERERLGLSQHDVAEALRMSQSDLSKIENCERRLDILEFCELLKVYRVYENCKLSERIQSFLGFIE